MTTVKKYNIQGDEIGEIKVHDQFLDSDVHSQLIKDYIIAIRKNNRQWNAHTKTRSEVVHTTKKPHPQKGTGRARQGMLSAPQYRGGGRVFGPRKKEDQHVRINKKEKKAALRHLLAEKIKANKLIVLDTTEMEKPKTAVLAKFLKAVGFERRPLFLGEGLWAEFEVGGEKFRFSEPTEFHDNLFLSMRNIPGAEFSLACNISGYDVICAHHLVVSEKALEELTEWLQK